jgi:hypothetical protein
MVLMPDPIPADRSIMPDHITIPEQYATDHEREAYRLGALAALSAASWAADGNTSDGHRRAVLAMLADGDPSAYDHLPEQPNLSGEWADAPTPHSLYEDIVGVPHAVAAATAGLAYETMVGVVIDALCEAWEAGVSEHFRDACESELRAGLTDDSTEDTSEDRCTDHGLDVCPDCGNGGIVVGDNGYEPCTRFLTCWSDPDA